VRPTDNGRRDLEAVLLTLAHRNDSAGIRGTLGWVPHGSEGPLRGLWRNNSTPWSGAPRRGNAPGPASAPFPRSWFLVGLGGRLAHRVCVAGGVSAATGGASFQELRRVALAGLGPADVRGQAIVGLRSVAVLQVANSAGRYGGGHNRCAEPGSGVTNPAVLGFNGLEVPGRVAVDSAGNLYAIDSGNNRVVKLTAR
jgi:hypothetical protein